MTMTLQDLASRGAGMGLRVVGKQVIGVYKNMPIRMCLNARGKHDVISTEFVTSKNVPTGLQKSIRKALPRGVSFLANTSASYVQIIANGSETDPFELTWTALDIALSMLQDANKPITAPETCPVCRKPGCDSAALVGRQFKPVHRECVVNQNENAAAKAAMNKNSGNIATGLLGAILGAIIGCIPNIICILALNLQLGILYMFVPLAAFKGYELFRGKLGSMARVIVILCSLAGFIVSQPVIFHLVLLGEGLNIPFATSVSYYIDYMTIAEIIESTWFGILFLIIGIGSRWVQLGASNADRMNDATVSVESVTNLDGSYQPVYTASVGTTYIDDYYNNPTGKDNSNPKPPMEF